MSSRLAMDRADPALDAALRAIAPSCVAVGSRRIDGADIAMMLPGERGAVAGAVERRRREFATGRALLRALIGTESAILVGDDRAPVLPPGVSASLAHDHAFAVAAVTRVPGLALGIDVEPVTPLADDIAALVLRFDERPLDAHLAFTLKEATYKAWSSRGGRMLDHHDVRLVVRSTTFAAEVVGEGVHFSGTFANTGDRWLALVVAGMPDDGD